MKDRTVHDDRPRPGTDEGAADPAAGQLLRSGLRFGWAMSVFGAQGLARVLGRRDVVEAFDQVTREARRQLRPAAREMLGTGERLAQDIAALWAGPGDLGRSLVEGGAGAARRASSLLAPLGGPAFERSSDLLFAAEHFAASALEPFELGARRAGAESVDAETAGAETAPGPARPVATGERLRRRAARLQGLESYAGLWQLEGLGYAYGRALGAFPDEPFEPGGLPESVRMPVLTGAALALSRHLLGRGDLVESARRHAELCDRWAPAGSGLMLFEATGFIAHQLMPLRFEEMAEAATALGERARAAFYHGVGRALYISLRGLVDARHPFERAAAIKERVPRQNATAGVVWAAALVHLRHPGQLESLLDDWSERLDARAVEHGLAGALTVWLNHLRGRFEDPIRQEHVAGLRRRQTLWPRLEAAFDRARRRIDDFERGAGSWDSVYVLMPERKT